MTKAAKESGTTLKTIRRYASSALEMRSGRLDATSHDRIPRDLLFLDAKGQTHIPVTNSRDASRVGRYHNAVRKFLITGDPKHLKPWVGKSVRVAKREYPFVTDPAVLNRLARAGQVHFLDIYKGGVGT
jgi:hypothetical protein